MIVEHERTVEETWLEMTVRSKAVILLLICQFVCGNVWSYFCGVHFYAISTLAIVSLRKRELSILFACFSDILLKKNINFIYSSD